jgi:hypothetical protein
VNGFDAIAAFAIGESDETVIYEPVSKLSHSSGVSSTVYAAGLGMDILWDNGEELIWDDDTNIGWEVA